MSGVALASSLRPCGPVVDGEAASRIREALPPSEVLAAAWPALAPVAAAAPYLARLMQQRPEGLVRTLELSPEARSAEIVAAARAVAGEETGTALRRLKADAHLAIALADLGGAWDWVGATGAMTRFADAVLEAALAEAVRLEVARGRMSACEANGAGPAPGLFVLAMGKHGAGELNYSSDIDISFFFEPERLPAVGDPAALAIRLAQATSTLLNERTADGYVFRTDLRLRPDPAATPPAVPVGAALTYYETAGQNWERAAFIKARVAAGDQRAGTAFLRELTPFVWRRSLDYGAIADVHAIKRQILAGQAEGGIKPAGADLKLGRGGIREIEFFVQTQQLILGGRNPALRSRRTVEALEALRDAGHVDAGTAEELTAAYGRLRAWEHRVQMVGDEQTHRLPAEDAGRRRIAALSGFGDLRRFDAEVRRTLRGVDRLYAGLFAGEEPLSSRFGSLVFTGVEDDPETMRTLERMGFTQAAQVSATIRHWHHGRIRATSTARGRELFTRLAPRLLEAARRTGAPDAAFSRFSSFFSGLSAGAPVQSMLLAEPAVLEQLVEVLAFAPDLARTLSRHPGALDALLDARFREPIGMSGAGEAVRAGVGEGLGLEAAMGAVRRIAREQRFRIGLQILTGAAKGDEAGLAYTDLAEVCLQALAPRALAEVERRGGGFPGAVAVLALGKAGSREMTARSDLDLLIVYAAEAGAASTEKGWRAETVYGRFAQQLIAALSAPMADGGLYSVDMRLRPAGTDGPLAVSLPVFQSYYAREAETWERMALTRSRVLWASPPGFAEQVEHAREALLRRPAERGGMVRDARAMRALLEREKPPNGVWDLKAAPGGLLDVEFAAQLLQLAHAAEGGPLRQGVAEALEDLAASGRLAARHAAPLLAGWRLQSNLAQLLAAALEEGADPLGEPDPFRRKLARTAGVRGVRALDARLRRVQSAVRRAWLQVAVATESAH
ncbi:MAG: bifunctional [glutamine synthetase] adenylyltransferase/[glutamine synthetase]-adenylyl-L-tyrosine phosphorylase [Proteobacteria bacterium]|nr:bifunctional [glutamine synthetase] adenylyltransferase/[glutamine synthetase]-adenylyl-L-tyrosine phosphorylase [Pseudomonadota bacterium]